MRNFRHVFLKIQGLAGANLKNTAVSIRLSALPSRQNVYNADLKVLSVLLRNIFVLHTIFDLFLNIAFSIVKLAYTTT